MSAAKWATRSAYNQAVVHILSLIRSRQFSFFGRALGLGLVLSCLLVLVAAGQTPGNGGSDKSAEERTVADRGRILLVLPFDNRTGQPSLDWIREGAAVLLSSRFSSAGFAPMSRTDRLYALDHLGLPQGFQPSRASSLKLAQTLDADSIIVGSYVTDGSGIIAEAQVVDVPHLRMSPSVTARGEMRDLVAVFDSLAWKLTRQIDPSFSLAEETFVAAGKGIRLEAFEQYIRGITEPDQAERLRHLNHAVLLSPDFGPAWMALGREDYNGQQFEAAANAFAKVGRNDADALEAGFYRGLSLVFSGDYPGAESAFASVAKVLPLAEVVNNQGVAASRHGRDGTVLFRQAVAADPNTADYHFNLAVSLKRHGNTTEAMAELAQCLRLHANDSEAQSLEAAWKGPVLQQVASNPGEPKADPLERIARSFDAAAFRQAAVVVDQMDATRMSALTPALRAQKLSLQARGYLDVGLLLEADRLFQSAVAFDPKLPDAHAGLAEVRELSGDAIGARREAVTSLQLMPSVSAYLVLGRLDLSAGHLPEATYDIDSALKIDPQNKAALGLHGQLEAKTTGQSK